MSQKPDIKQVNDVAREFRMDRMRRKRFGGYLEECKVHGEHGSQPNGDFTYRELRAKAREFLEGQS